jgi:predicted RecB family nuclease
MQLVDNKLVLSASDLNNYLACRHLAELDLALAKGKVTLKAEPGADAELLAQKGDEHEAQYLASLIADGRDVAQIPQSKGPPEALSEAVAATEAAMRRGAEVIFQGTFLRDGMRGHADFLFRVDKPSKFGEYSYEVADTKLARRAKPYFIVQLCFYSELVAAIQRVEPDHIHVILGDERQATFRLAEFSAYFRHVREELIEVLGDGGRDTYPEPVEHCSLCRWRGVCDARRVEDDHLSLVANISRRQRDLLQGAGIATLAELGRAEGLSVDGIDGAVIERLHEQAALQLAARESGEHHFRLLTPEAGRGFSRLPKPSPGDVFFDIEGDPFFADGGLEYLFGLVTEPVNGGAEPPFTAIWGCDRAEEKAALEEFIDFVTERRHANPDPHVYHYASYEITALKRLAASHGTREEELDQLLRDEVFVDLYKVVKESIRISQPSYSIKKVETFYMEERSTNVTDGGDSVIMFERWLDEGDQGILDAIADYNEDDCVSTLLLRDWLLELRDQAEERFAGTEAAEAMTWFDPEPAERGENADEVREESEARVASLIEGIPEDPSERSEDQDVRWLMAQLLEYHRREARPVWWAFFDRQDAEMTDLVRDADCLGDLTPEGAPRKEKRSHVHLLRFPVQETKLGARSDVFDANGGAKAGEIVTVDPAEGTVELKRGPSLVGQTIPRAVIPGGPYDTRQQRDALWRLARSLGSGGDALGAYPAAEQILRRLPPRVAGREPGVDAVDPGRADINALKEVVAGLENSYLFIQGPPGSGKTWSGARLVVDLIRRGNRVGVTSTSHKVIHNMLDEIEEVARNEGATIVGLKKCSDGNPESVFEGKHGQIESVSDNGALSDSSVTLTAGTAWHYCREDTARLDYLFIDEAGQISLADALALSTAARNVVLLGDPQQLPQVAQGAHPPGVSLSVLEHLLSDAQTVHPTRGVFLAETWRLHPDVTEFVSELMYDGRLRSAPGRELQRVDAEGELNGTGLRWTPVEHEGRSQASPEEAEAIKKAIDPLLASGRYTDAEGIERPLTAKDILVVTPYNAQVKCLEEHLASKIRIGTVDKFQGQEAQVVFFSMATSSDDEIPRNVEFLFSRNRLNVAVSRVRCLSVLVCSPRLLDVRANSIEQMKLINALCRFAELALSEQRLP